MATKKTLESLKASFGSSDPAPKTEYNSNYYPFWDMKTDQSCVIRFLPDLAEDNPRGFLVEKVSHNLTINGERKTVTCLGMFDEDCPICKISQDYYKVEDKVNGKKYWKKKQYIAQCLVVTDPLPANKDTGETHEGKVRYVSLGFQLYNIIKEAFASDTEPLEGIPYDFQDGYDFIIKKTEKGGYADYSVGTKFRAKQRSLTEDELAAVGDGMVDLSTLLPKNPGLEKVQAMLNADLNGESYSDKKDSDNEEFETRSSSVTKTVKNEDVPFDNAVVAKKTEKVSEESGSSDVDTMLEQIRARRKTTQPA